MLGLPVSILGRDLIRSMFRAAYAGPLEEEEKAIRIFHFVPESQTPNNKVGENEGCVVRF
jgi:hypothetical protein